MSLISRSGHAAFKPFVQSGKALQVPVRKARAVATILATNGSGTHQTWEQMDAWVAAEGLARVLEQIGWLYESNGTAWDTGEQNWWISQLAPEQRSPQGQSNSTFRYAFPEPQPSVAHGRAAAVRTRGRVARAGTTTLPYKGATTIPPPDAAPLSPMEVRPWSELVREELDLLDFWVFAPSTTEWVLSLLVVPWDQRKRGRGTEAMRRLVEQADLAGARIWLTPTARDPRTGTTSRARLVHFYKRFGFVENKGRHYDPSRSNSMYRDPRGGPS